MVKLSLILALPSCALGSGSWPPPDNGGGDDSACCLVSSGYVNAGWEEAGNIVTWNAVTSYSNGAAEVLSAYVVYPSDVGADVDHSAERAVILAPGTRGFNSGRQREYADLLAERGYVAVIPKVLNNGVDIYDAGCDGDGLACNEVGFDDIDKYRSWTAKHGFDGYLDSKIQLLLDTLPQANLNVIGFCWGTYFAAHFAILGGDRVKAIASPHPSLEIALVNGEDTVALAGQMTQPTLLVAGCDGLCDPSNPTLQCPFLCFPDNPELYNPEYGTVVEALQLANPESMAIQKYRMNHGWTLTGDFNNDFNGAIFEDNVGAMDEIFNWICVHNEESPDAICNNQPSIYKGL